jgi:hypothetical protein
VNDFVEILGAGPAAELLAAVDEPPAAALDEELDDDDDDELPQAATPMLADTASAAIRGLLLSKCTWTSSSSIRAPPRGRSLTLTAQRLSQ